MRFNSVLDSKFRGCQQIGYLDDPNTGMHLRIYALPSHLLKDGEEALVGVKSPATCSIASSKYSLFDMKKGISPDHPEEVRTRVRSAISNTKTVTRRAVICAPSTPTTPRRRAHVIN